MPDSEEPELFRNVLEGLRSGIFLVGQNRKIFFWNDGAEAITGFRAHDVLGHSVSDNVLNRCDEKGCVLCGAVCPFSSTLQNGKVQESRVQLHHKEGHRVPVRLCATPIRNPHGTVTVSAQSFDEQKFAFDRDRRQHNLASYGCLDEMTGLPNHSFTQFHLRENLASFAEYHLPFGIMSIRINELDHFRASYGREAAAAIVQVVGSTVRNTLRPSDFLGRWMEDEFLIIMPNCTASGVHTGAERIRRIIHFARLQWWGDHLSVTTQIGDAAAQTGDTIEMLLERARHSQQTLSSQSAVASSSENTNLKS